MPPRAPPPFALIVAIAALAVVTIITVQTQSPDLRVSHELASALLHPSAAHGKLTVRPPDDDETEDARSLLLALALICMIRQAATAARRWRFPQLT